MATKVIRVDMFAKMFLAGAQNLDAQKEYINGLNVFPVPDGDTGTNMTLTIMSAAKEVTALDNPSMSELAKAISSGSLRGARGNSGVILSQLLRGFTKVIREVDEIDAQVFADALQRAKETAYKAVMKPKEGTILTVATGIADKATELAQQTDDLEEIIPEILACARDVLEKTPDLLPVLKEAGVVDSGGTGLVEVLSGAYDAFLGKEIDYSSIEPGTRPSSVPVEAEDDEEIKFGYCTEYIIETEQEMTDEMERSFKEYLSSIGDSIVCVRDDELVKVHVHSNDPGLAIQKGLTYGPLSRIKIDNMREEHQEKLIKDASRLAKEQEQADAQRAAAQAEKAGKDEPAKPMGFVAVSIGDGLNEIFKELGVDVVIEGGQTMNPSTEDLLRAIDQVNADSIFILPNNKNIVLTANQAMEMRKDKQIIVIPTKTVPQGITALINYMPEADPKENEQAMLDQIQAVKSGQVTYAIRDTCIDDRTIHEGDIMGIGDDGIVSVSPNVADTTKEMIQAFVDEESELISLYYGEEVPEADALALAKELETMYPDIDVDIQFGGQPIYYYVLAVE